MSKQFANNDIECSSCATNNESTNSKILFPESSALNLNNSVRIALHIQEMDCEDEVILIQRKMQTLNGVLSHNTNLMTQQLHVDYNPKLLSQTDIISAIREIGMSAIVLEEKQPSKKRWWQETKIIFLLMSSVFTAAGLTLEQLSMQEIFIRIVYTLAIIIGGIYPTRSGIQALKSFTLNINTLLIAAVIGAVALGLWEEAAILVVIYSLGSVLEAYAVDKARGSIRALMQLAPNNALVKKNKREISIPVDQINIGDVIIVKPGDRIPMDGTVVYGSSAVDQSPITGESIPLNKVVGDEVFAGTLNQRGSLEIQVTKLSKDTTLARIIHSVEEAQARKSSYQRFSERFGRVYTPLMFVLAILVAIIPPLILAESFSIWFYRGLILLVVSCSCGLVLSVPVAVVAAIGNGAKSGILIKGGAYLEIAGGIEVIAFDKTGTLTMGKPEVTDIVPLNEMREEEILTIAAAIESRSEHPLADAILRAASKEFKPEVADFEAIPGFGAKGKIKSTEYIIGNERLFQQKQIRLNGADRFISKLEEEGKTVMLLGNANETLGVIAVADEVRPQAIEAIKKLKESGVKHIVMLTGDNERTAKAIAAKIGIDDYKAKLLPDDKIAAVRELKQQYGKVAMIGDGINDAPAMAEADVGIAMGGIGTDVALETGDIVLMADDLTKLPTAFELSRKSISNIKQNIIASLAIVVFLVGSALLGKMDLVGGLLINEVGALIVIANGLRLYKIKI